MGNYDLLNLSSHNDTSEFEEGANLRLIRSFPKFAVVILTWVELAEVRPYDIE